MEIGSFIEIQFPRDHEYYSGDGIARLNTGRAAIWHALRVLGCDTVWLPYYQCDTVRSFLVNKRIKEKYYHINPCFDPVDIMQAAGEAVVLVNYYGVMRSDRMAELASHYNNVILDNAQAFFAKPIEHCINIYSTRKFIGVPDGAYVFGEGADRFTSEYEKDFSSDTSLFLLQRIEYGCEGRAYDSREQNEKRINESDVKLMSTLTRTILDGTDYDSIMRKRRENFAIACKLFDGFNKLNAARYMNSDCVPMVYPLVIEDDMLLTRMLEAKHFQGRWWSYLASEMPEDTFENYLSRYMVPITIDQRYGRKELEYIKEAIV